MKKINLSLLTSALICANLYGAEKLDNVVVYGATKSNQSIKDVTSNVNVITAAQLENRNINTALEALNLVSGVNFTSNGGLGATTSVNLRGSSNNRILVLIDGVKYKDHSSISGTDLAHIMLNDVERIEVIKGAQSGIWGADAAAGVINIITKNQKDGVSGSVFAEGGSFNTQKYGASVGHKNKTYDIKLSVQKITSDGFTSKLTKGDDIDDFEDDSYENTTFNVKSNIAVSDNAKLNINITSVDALKEYDSSSADDESMINDVNTKSYHVSYNRKMSNHDLTVKYESTNIQRDQIGTTWGVKETDSTSSNFEVKDVVSYGKNDFILAGFGATKDEMDYVKADTTKSDAKNEASYIYVTNSNKLLNLVLTESLRYDDYDNFAAKTTGKIGAKLSISKQVDLFANYGTAYSVPNLVQNINPWGATNMDIKPEESKSYDIGFRFGDLKATYFEQEVTDLISWYDPTPTNYFNNDAIYKNLDGENKFKGFEVEYSKNVLDTTLFSFNYTSLCAKDKDGKYLARRAKETLKFTVDYYGVEKLHVGINGEYIGERFDKADKKGAQTGKYTVTNLVANYNLLKSLKAYVKVDNLTDKEYQTVDGYATSPRAYYAGIKYNF